MRCADCGEQWVAVGGGSPAAPAEAAHSAVAGSALDDSDPGVSEADAATVPTASASGNGSEPEASTTAPLSDVADEEALAPSLEREPSPPEPTAPSGSSDAGIEGRGVAMGGPTPPLSPAATETAPVESLAAPPLFAPARPRRAARRNTSALAVTATITIVAAGALTSAVVFRRAIVDRAPELAGVYAAVGLGVDPPVRPDGPTAPTSRPHG